jgi:hypothetical protein
MSMIACSTCTRFEDTDGDFGEYDVPEVNSTKRYAYMCGVCRKKYITEDRQFDPELGFAV